MRVFCLGFLLVALNFSLPTLATAKEGEFPTLTLPVILWSARSCYAEATWSQADCSALLHVIRKRATKAGWSFLRMLNAYSVRNWVQSAHGQAALELQLGTNEGKSLAWNQNWQKLVIHVVDVLLERKADPCPTADHWAAKYYQPKSPMQRVSCEVETSNTFWVEIASR